MNRRKVDYRRNSTSDIEIAWFRSTILYRVIVVLLVGIIEGSGYYR